MSVRRSPYGRAARAPRLLLVAAADDEEDDEEEEEEVDAAADPPPPCAALLLRESTPCCSCCCGMAWSVGSVVSGRLSVSVCATRRHVGGRGAASDGDAGRDLETDGDDDERGVARGVATTAPPAEPAPASCVLPAPLPEYVDGAEEDEEVVDAGTVLAVAA